MKSYQLKLIPRTLDNLDVLYTDCPYSELKRVYGAVAIDNGWVFPAENPFLSFVYSDIQKLKLWRDKILVIDPVEEEFIKTCIESNLSQDLEIPVLSKTVLYPHQEKALRRLLLNPRFGLYMDCRTGKTLVVLYRIAMGGLKTLVVCPKIACENWIKENNQHFPQLKALSIYGETKKIREKLLDKAANEDYDIVITSFENLRIVKDAVKEKINYDTIIVDEAHRIKTYDAERTLAIMDVAPKAKYRYLLTGTPTLGEPTDLFAQMQILHPSIFLNFNYWKFTQYFLVYKKPAPYRIPGGKVVTPRPFPVATKNIDSLNRLVAPFVIRIRRDECNGLPDRENVVIKYELGNKQKELYRQIIDNDSITLDGITIEISNSVVKFQKLMNVCSGFLYYYPPGAPLNSNGEPDKKYRKIYIIEGNPKLLLLKEYLEDTLAEPNSKVIIWCNYDQEQDELVSNLKDYNVVQLRGGNKDPFATVKQFTEDPTVRILCGKESSGISVDLSVASIAFNYSRHASLDFDIQSRDRIDGYKQKAQKIINYYFAASNTVESQMHELIQSKIDLDKQLLDINKKCIGCKHLVNCRINHISYGDKKCSYENSIGK